MMQVDTYWKSEDDASTLSVSSCCLKFAATTCCMLKVSKDCFAIFAI